MGCGEGLALSAIVAATVTPVGGGEDEPVGKGVAGALTLAALGGLPFATLDGVEQLLFVSRHLHRRTPHRGVASSPRGAE
jgi:hypothetical protein